MSGELTAPGQAVAGGWRADRHGLFVAHIDGGDGRCMPKQGDPTPGWLRTVSRYAPDGDGFLLRTVDGATVARLAPDTDLDQLASSKAGAGFPDRLRQSRIEIAVSRPLAAEKSDLLD